jgi:hypothetical protein
MSRVGGFILMLLGGAGVDHVGDVAFVTITPRSWHT